MRMRYELGDDPDDYDYYDLVFDPSVKVERRKRPQVQNNRARKKSLGQSDKRMFLFRPYREIRKSDTSATKRAIERTVLELGVKGVNPSSEFGITPVSSYVISHIFDNYYRPNDGNDSLANSATNFNDIISLHNHGLNIASPRLKLEIGKISIFGLDREEKGLLWRQPGQASPYGLNCSIEEPALSQILAERAQLLGAILPEAEDLPKPLRTYTPRLILAKVFSRQVAESLVPQLDSINDIASLTGQTLMTERSQLREIPIV